MKFTLSWLRDHLDTQADLATICETLTRIGLEVEHVHDPAAALRDFVVARIISADQHPNADRLRVCSVDVGGPTPVQVVCGAPNARAGLVSVFAAPGVRIPAKDFVLTKGNVRGVDSNGMLCSAAELGLSEEHDGIIELSGAPAPGTSYATLAGLDDPVIEINLTPNRQDATGVAGIARDLAAAGLGKLKTPPVAAINGSFDCPVNVTLDFANDDAHLAPAFALRLVRNVKNGASPDWMQKRLKAIGLRPINALVDITNYITFDRGRPLHVFDAKKVVGNLVVRRARDGEQIVALDGRSYTLDNSMVVIADNNNVESIAGVMGGEHSGCDENTTDVLIESALWDPLTIARTGRTLGIQTDARYRFERGVDPDFCAPGAELATQMVQELCGGEPSHLIFAGKQAQPRNPLIFAWSEVARLTGLHLETPEMAGILEKLGFDVAPTPGNADRTFVRPPSWRTDVEGAADLVEEIVRIAGLERVIATPLPRNESVPAPVLTLLQKRVSGARRALAARGLMEAINWSFVNEEQAKIFGGGDASLKLVNPIAADLSDMRPSLLPGLLAAAQRNADRGIGDVALCEVGQIFLGASDKDQRMAAGAIRRGTAKPMGAGRNWDGASTNVDVFDAKQDMLALLSALGVATGSLQLVPRGPDWFHPGRSGTFQLGPKNILGFFGELHPAVLDALGVEGPLCAFEVILDNLPAPKAKATRAKPTLNLSAFMPLSRDFAFVVDRSVAAGDIVKAAQAAERAMITDVSVFDIYAGKGVADDKKSVAIGVTLQPRERTLTEPEIDAISARIVAEVARKTGAVLRA